MASPLLRLADLLLTQCGVPHLWPHSNPASAADSQQSAADPADCRRLQVRQRGIHVNAITGALLARGKLTRVSVCVEFRIRPTGALTGREAAATAGSRGSESPAQYLHFPLPQPARVEFNTKPR